MDLVSAERDGWHRLRLVTFRRDRGCVAVQPEVMGEFVAKDLCRNAAGFVMPWNAIISLEWSHQKEQAMGGRKASNDEAHGVACCPWHHRGDGWRIDKDEHIQKVREYLARLYPDVWADVPAVQS